MKPIQRIVACTDFSDSGNRAIETAFRLAAAGSVTVVLVHVVEQLPLPDTMYGHFRPGPMWDPETIRRMADAAESQLRSLVPAEAKERRIEIKLSTPTGSVVEEILRVAHEHQAEVIVVGTHGLRGLPRLFIGSVADRVVKLSERPVVVVH